MSIKTNKGRVHARLHALLDINAQIVKGFNVSHKIVKDHSTVMALKRYLNIAMLGHTIQSMGLTTKMTAKIVPQVTIVLTQLDKPN